jgi:undecaprenyl-diphosphatase
VLLALLGVLAAAVQSVPWFDAMDHAVVRAAHGLGAEATVAQARELTLIGGTDAVAGLTVAIAAALALLRRRREALALAVAVASTELGVSLVKHLMLRPRPPAADAVAHATGYSFPSGHAAASLALFGSVAFLASRTRSPRSRLAIGLVFGALLVAIGLTRVRLGVHYPTDVVAGWLLAGGITLAAWHVLTLPPTRRARRRSRAASA